MIQGSVSAWQSSDCELIDSNVSELSRYIVTYNTLVMKPIPYNWTALDGRILIMDELEGPLR